MSDTKDLFLQGQEIVKRTGIKDFQLLDFVNSGLQPYTETGLLLESPGFRAKTVERERIDKKLKSLAHEREIRFPSINVPKNWVPDKHNPRDVMTMNILIERHERKSEIESFDARIKNHKKKKNALKRKLAHIQGSSWREYIFPENEKLRKNVVNVLLNSFYRESDIINFPELEKAIEPEPEELKDAIGKTETSSSDVAETDAGPFQFKVTEGTTWRDIHLVIRNNDLTEWLEVNGAKGPLGNFKPEAIGFRGHGGPGTVWTLLNSIAELRGVLTPQGVKPIKHTMTRLRKELQRLFPGIEGDPIPWHKTEKSWRTAFHIELSRYEEE